jgi:hypothetical protein
MMFWSLGKRLTLAVVLISGIWALILLAINS